MIKSIARVKGSKCPDCGGVLEEGHWDSEFVPSATVPQQYGRAVRCQNCWQVFSARGLSGAELNIR